MYSLTKSSLSSDPLFEPSVWEATSLHLLLLYFAITVIFVFWAYHSSYCGADNILELCHKAAPCSTYTHGSLSRTYPWTTSRLHVELNQVYIICVCVLHIYRYRFVSTESSTKIIHNSAGVQEELHLPLVIPLFPCSRPLHWRTEQYLSCPQTSIWLWSWFSAFFFSWTWMKPNWT